MDNVILYYFPTCPYCRKVLDFMEHNNIDIPTKNIRESSENRKELEAIAGSSQVPCLIIDGKALHESDDIITWLEENLSYDA